MVSMRAMECLVTIAEQDSLTQAAAVLHMSPRETSYQDRAMTWRGAIGARPNLSSNGGLEKVTHACHSTASL